MRGSDVGDKKKREDGVQRLREDHGGDEPAVVRDHQEAVFPLVGDICDLQDVKG